MDDARLAVYQDRGLQLAKAMRMCQGNDPPYYSAAALLAVHSAIAYNDAVQIMLTGKRSQFEDHRRALKPTMSACQNARIDPKGIEQLRILLGAKTDVSYVDKLVEAQIAFRLCTAADRFEAWAQRYVFGRR
jgi:hypothetical protein